MGLMFVFEDLEKLFCCLLDVCDILMDSVKMAN